jgi:hypothetical protein
MNLRSRIAKAPLIADTALPSAPVCSVGISANSIDMMITPEMSSSSATSISNAPDSEPSASASFQTADDTPTLVAVSAAATNSDGIKA